MIPTTEDLKGEVVEIEGPEQTEESPHNSDETISLLPSIY
jgi:hypothetical protein